EKRQERRKRQNGSIHRSRFPGPGPPPDPAARLTDALPGGRTRLAGRPAEDRKTLGDLQMLRADFTPAAEGRPAEDLAELAAAINAEHGAGEEASRRGLEHFRAAGEKLIRAKAACGHGRWLKWLEKNVRFGQSTAKNYMRLAKSPTVGDLAEA